MNFYLMIAAGGALGAVARYLVGTAMERFNTSQFPIGTFAVNLLGSFLIGVIFIVLLEKIQWSEQMKPLIVIGFLGAFTTFSTFSLEIILLLQQGNYLTAGMYTGLSVLICLLATFGGMAVMRSLF